MSDKNCQKRYVAFFDVLGFTQAVKNNHREAWGALVDLRVSMEDALRLFTTQTHNLLLLPNSIRTQATNFSDSVMIFSLSDDTTDLHTILIESAHLFAKALARCVPLRGGISWGDFSVNFEKNLFCGLPLIKAHEIGQKGQWSGIIVDENVAMAYQKNPLTSFDKQVIVKRNVPIKSDVKENEEYWVLDWPCVFRKSFNCEPPISGQQYSAAFERLFGCSYQDWPADIQAKHDNTAEFINWSMKR